MKVLVFILAALLLGPLPARAQTREETIEFLTSEYRAFESRGYLFKEITFSPAGDSFTLRRSAQGEKGYVISFNLKDVEIYKVTLNHANGINKFQLMVRARGRDAVISKDGNPVKMPLKISPAMDNERKAQALERAFTRLTALTTGRKFLFYTP
jgi:uncharacterized protein YkuJ